MTVLRPRSMLVFLWPIVLLHPHPVVREYLPFQRMGLQNWYLLLCLVIILADPRRVRQGLATSMPVVRRTLLLLLVVGLAHLHAVFVLWLRYPWLPDVGWDKVLEQLMSDLLYAVPFLGGLAYVRDRSDRVVAIRAFALSLFAAFALVIGDRLSPIVFDLFNHTGYVSTWKMHAERAVGGFGGPWEVGGIGALGIVFATVAALGQSVLGRVTAIVLLVVTTAGVVFAVSRAGYVGMALAILGVLLVTRGGAKWRALALLAAAAVVLLFLQVQAPSGEMTDITSMVEQGIDRAYDEGELRGSAAVRARIWRDHVEYLRSGNLEWSQILAGLGGLEGVGVTLQSTGHNGYLAPYLYYGLPWALLMHLALLGAVLASLQGRVWSTHPEIFVMWATVLGGMVTSEFLISNLTASVLAFLVVVTAAAIPGNGVRAPPVAGPPVAAPPRLPPAPRHT
jgi:hypothetical protein